MAYERNFTEEDDLFIGEDLLLSFEVFQDNLVVDSNGAYVSGTPQDVSGWAISFLVRTSDTTSNAAVITKSVGSGIAITGSYNASHSLNTQRVEVTIADTDTWPDVGTPLSAPKNYRHSLKRTDAGSEKILAFGDFYLRKATARA